MITLFKGQVESKEEWNQMVIENNGSFLQSSGWAKFQESLGRKVFFLKGNKWQAMMFNYDLPLGKSYLYCPRGPIIILNINPVLNLSLARFRNTGQISKIFQEFLDKIQKLVKQERAIFIRIEPTNREITEDFLKEFGFLKSKDIQPSKTLILDLNLSEEELLGEMHPKTRYNISLAQRKGMTVRKTEEYNEKDFEIFWDLVNQTAKRQGIRIFSKEYYRKQLTIDSKQFENLLFIAEYQGETIAANLVNFFGQTATYLHGGSGIKFRHLMAPHLLQWQQIKEAKKRGCQFYDFWGINEARWPGITRFKKGFAGQETSYLGTFDLVFSPVWYKIYNLVRRILR